MEKGERLGKYKRGSSKVWRKDECGNLTIEMKIWRKYER